MADHKWWRVKNALISPEEIRELQPQLNIEGVGAAAYFEEAGNCDPVALTNVYAARARELGVSICEETEVTDIRVSAE